MRQKLRWKVNNLQMNPLSKFDLDLQFGQRGERWLEWLGTPEAKVEIKTERDSWQITGNACFEFECRGKPSGVAVTESDFWVHIFVADNRVCLAFIWPVEYLKHFLRKAYVEPKLYGARLVQGGDDKASKILLIPISQLYLIGY